MNSLRPAAGTIQRASTVSYVRIARHHAHRRLLRQAHVRWLADVADPTNALRRDTLASQLSLFLAAAVED